MRHGLRLRLSGVLYSTAMQYEELQFLNERCGTMWLIWLCEAEDAEMAGTRGQSIVREGILACHDHMLMRAFLLRIILEADALTNLWCCWTALDDKVNVTTRASSRP